MYVLLFFWKTELENPDNFLSNITVFCSNNLWTRQWSSRWVKASLKVWMQMNNLMDKTNSIASKKKNKEKNTKQEPLS